ncbi:hypothetical protein R1sor_005476 [Riccia sorocarpa]|uniref:Uncharacterized protein n=1 Tax=Riccia sorocarpa TaxID=122646 RepID=A0ABD3HNJ1_9MARC
MGRGGYSTLLRHACSHPHAQFQAAAHVLHYDNVHLHGGIPSPGLYHSPASDDFDDSDQPDDFQEFHVEKELWRNLWRTANLQLQTKYMQWVAMVQHRPLLHMSTVERKSAKVAAKLPAVLEEDWYELIDSFMATRPCVTTSSSADSYVQEGIDDLPESITSDRDNNLIEQPKTKTAGDAERFERQISVDDRLAGGVMKLGMAIEVMAEALSPLAGRSRAT